jgi:hypothetical protein
VLVKDKGQTASLAPAPISEECRWPQQTDWELSSLYKCSWSSPPS